MDNGHMKGCSASLVIRGMQIKAIVGCHLAPVRMAIIPKTVSKKCWGGYGEKGMLHMYTVGRIINWYKHCEHSINISQKIKIGIAL